MMRIMMLSWEYPPRNIGGLSAHVYHLSQALHLLGHEVHVITYQDGSAAAEENDKGVIVHRVTPLKIHSDDFVKNIMHLNYAMIEEGIRLFTKLGKFDILHAHDWLTAYSAAVLKQSFKLPLVCTIHATEHGRNGGIRTEMQQYISSTEWMLTYEAWKVVVCSNAMRDEVHHLFSSPWDKIWVIPNGVNIGSFDLSFNWLSFRRHFASDNEKIIYYVGRHVFEKGLHLLVEAAPIIVNQYHDVKFIIAGAGPMTEEIKTKVATLGLEQRFLFTGFIEEDCKNKLYKVSDIAVFPSLYEPFGIVALEAMAAGCPVVASDVGGLSEIIRHGENGLKSWSGSQDSVASNILELLKNENLAASLRENAIRTVIEKYTWGSIANLTLSMYSQVKSEAKECGWS